MQTIQDENAVSDSPPSTSPPPHPVLPTHQSNSVPVTPQTGVRRLSLNARSPSPTQGLGNGDSPQSAPGAEQNRLRRNGSPCRFHTAMEYSKRRIPYSVGGDMLERSKQPPKKFLGSEQESKLTKDMYSLYDKLLPSKESEERRAAFVTKLEAILNKRWPGHETKVHVFGSSGNLLCTSESDGKLKTPMTPRTQLMSRSGHMHHD